MKQFGIVFGLLLSLSTAVANPTADYFARFKYTLAEALDVLKNADGKPMADAIEARNLLDDMGYWSLVRNQSVLKLTPELKNKIEAHYSYLQKAYSYEAGDLVWVKAENAQEKAYGVGDVNHRAQIKKHMRIDGTDYYEVEVYVDGANQMSKRQGTFYDGRKGDIVYYSPNYQLTKVTKVINKVEMDALNSPASSLPVDNVGEVLDWAKDQVWRDKLEAFKSKMASKNFEIDFTQPPQEIEKKQQELMLELFRHFKMNRNAPSNNGRGIGLRSCGGGVCFDQALVLTFGIQALGQTLGIKAYNLNGTTVNPLGGHGFVRYDLKTNLQEVIFDRVFPYELWESEYNKRKAALKDPNATLEVDFDLPPEKAIYKGVSVRTKTWTGISDPGWADYGVTPDFFARVSVNKALNPLPVDSNRAVNGLSSQRSLSEVSEKIQARGPLNTYSVQQNKSLDSVGRAKIAELFKKQSAPARQCRLIFGN